MSILNPELLRLAAEKTSQAVSLKEGFVDPAMAAAGGGGGAPMDPAMMGAAPPMDPAMMGGGAPMDPAMMGAAPPMDPAMMGAAPPADAGGGGGGMTPEDVRAIVQEVMAQQGGGAGNAGSGEKKMKVDVNQEIYQIKKLLVLMAEEMGLPVPPTMLLGDPAQDPHVPDSEAAKDPLSAAATQQGPAQSSAIPPIEPMPAASPALAAGENKAASLHRGRAVASSEVTVRQTTDKARALLAKLNAGG